MLHESESSCAYDPLEFAGIIKIFECIATNPKANECDVIKANFNLGICFRRAGADYNITERLLNEAIRISKMRGHV